jgi:hypothetical protein
MMGVKKKVSREGEKYYFQKGGGGGIVIGPKYKPLASSDVSAKSYPTIS